MIKKNKKPIIFLVILMLIASLIPPSNPVSAINVIQDGIPFSSTTKYKMPEFPGAYDYFYRENWDVIVDGSNEGQAVLLVPKGDLSHLGRTMFHNDTVFHWGKVFNGNPNYVTDMMSSNRTKINRVSDKKAFYRNYSVELGRHSGAIVKSAGTMGNGYLQVTTSPFPTISKLQVPSSVKQNTDFNVTFSGTEYDPFSSTLEYIITVDGYTKASGRLTGAQLGATPPQNGTIANKVEKIQVSGTGTHTVELSLYDGIKRPTRKTISLTVAPADPIPVGKAYLEIEPSVQQVEVGQSAAYVANYYDTTGKKTVVTTSSGSTWSATNTTIGQLQTKGNFKGITEGSTPIKVTYSGLTATAQLVVTNTPTPPPPEPTNEPPTVEIQGPDEVMTGEPFCLQADAYDSDGTINNYSWNYNGNGVLTKSIGCDLSYPTEGLKEVDVVVTDDKGAEGSDDHFINVLPPQPTAAFSVSGTLKENRKVNLTPVHPYGNKNGVISAFPMVEEKWTVTALTSANQAAIKTVQNINGNLTYQQVVDILMKKAGDYKIKRYVKNSIGLSDTVETTITIVPDLAPVADFSTVTVLYRDQVKATDADTSKAIIKATDFSYSRDDQISKRVWTIAFDSNNNGDFADETPTVISNVNETEVQYTTDKVGKYKLELEVFEEFAQPTIDQFVDVTYTKASTDRRFHDTSKANPDKSNVVKPLSERVIEVDNLAPTVSYDVQEQKKINIQMDITESPYTKTELESVFGMKLRPKLDGEQVQFSVDWFENNGIEVTDIKLGGNFGLALTKNKEVYSWGNNNEGQLGTGNNLNSTVPVKVLGLGNISSIEVSTSTSRGFAINEFGQVWTWGSNTSTSYLTNVLIPVQITNLPPTKEISASWSTLALTTTGEVYSWGLNQDGELGNGTAGVANYNPTKITSLSNIVDIDTGGQSSYAVNSTGRVYVWGLNQPISNDPFHGSLGTASNLTQVKSPQLSSYLTNIKEVSAASLGGFAVSKTGDLFGWGYNAQYAVGDGTNINRNTPVKVLTSVIKAEATFGSSFAVNTSGKLFVWGSVSNGQISPSNSGNAWAPWELSSLSNIKNFTTNGNAIISTDNNNVSYGHGNTINGLLLDGVTLNTKKSVTKIDGFGGITGEYYDSKDTSFKVNVTNNSLKDLEKTKNQIASMGDYFVGAGNDVNKLEMEEVIAANGKKGLFISNTPIDSFVNELGNYILSQVKKKQVELQIDITDSPFTEAQLLAAKPTMEQQLNEYDLNLNLEVFKRKPNRSIHTIDATGSNSYLIMENGEVWATGDNYYGQLGIGTKGGNALSPGKMLAPWGTAKVVNIAVGIGYTLILLDNGEVWGTGDNYYGNLGNGTMSASSTPIKMQAPWGSTKVVSIAAGFSSSMLLENGEVWVVGRNDSGELGDGTMTTKMVPVKMINSWGAAKVAEVYSSRFSTHIRLENGEMWGAGHTSTGALGVDLQQDQSTPVKMETPWGSAKVVNIDVGENTTTILLDNGDVWGTGYNTYGELGDGTRTTRKTPVKMLNPWGTSKVIDISTSLNHTLLHLENGEIWGVGKNILGQLGTSYQTNYDLTPVKMKNTWGTAKVVNIAAGGVHSLVQLENGEVWGTGDNTAGNLGTNNRINYTSPVKMEKTWTTTQLKAPPIQGEDGYKQTNNELFTSIISNNSVDSAQILTDINSLKSIFIGVGNTTNKAQLETVIATNSKGGKYLNHNTLSSDTSAEKDTKARELMKEMAIFIIEQSQNEKVDLVFGVGDITSQAEVSSKINSIIIPKLNAEGITANRVVVENNIYKEPTKSSVMLTDMPEDYSGDEAAWFGGTWALSGSTAATKIRTDKEITINSIAYFNRGNSGPVKAEIRKSDGTVLTSQTVSVPAVVDKIMIPLDTPVKVLPNEDYYVSIQGSIGVAFLRGSLSHTKNVDNVNISLETGYEISATNQPGQTGYSTAIEIYIEKPDKLSAIHDKVDAMKFYGLLENQAISVAEENLIFKNLLQTDSNFGGMGNTTNKIAMQSIIDKNMKKGIFIENANLDSTLSQYADYIIAEVAKRRNTKEVYVTLDEQVKYFTTYNDFELDPKYQDRWKYDHLPTIFENDMGQDSRQMRDLATPIENFNKVGRYQPFYSAQDDPLTGLFPVDRLAAFEPYRKWAKDADNWFIYVHRKPVPEFNFTVNGTTGDYTITNKAFDLDKQSVEIGFGPGLKSQAFQWREQGQMIWLDGVPASPLLRKVYEVKNTVVDFQKREESMVKLLDATGVNKPPIPQFELLPERIPQNSIGTPKDFSYDPNGDAIVGYQWQLKKQGEPDTAFVDIPGTSNIKAPNINFATLGTFVIRLKVKDAPGLWSAPPTEWYSQIVEVYSPNTAPVGGFNVTPTQYIGQTIAVTSTASDADNDVLQYEYVVKPPSAATFTVKTGQPYTDRKGNIISISVEGHMNVRTYDQTDVGTWTFTQRVTDSAGATAPAIIKTAIVTDLTVNGNVLHTAEWEKIHIDKGNLPDEFYSGEKFMLKADVINRPLKSVKVTATGRLENNTNFNATVDLLENSNILYIGEYFESRFAEMGTQILAGSTVQFVFTATYDNGTPTGYVVTDTVIVKIIGSGIGILDFHQSF